jgi:hypothetical protein
MHFSLKKGFAELLRIFSTAPSARARKAPALLRGALMRPQSVQSSVDLDQQTLYYRCFPDVYC